MPPIPIEHITASLLLAVLSQSTNPPLRSPRTPISIPNSNHQVASCTSVSIVNLFVSLKLQLELALLESPVILHLPDLVLVLVAEIV